MILKSELEQAYRLQQEVWQDRSGFIERDYLGHFRARGKHIDVISGIRRCGKSTLMRQLMARYTLPVAYFNFEDPRVYDFEATDFQKLDEIIGLRTTVYFFDEIQNISGWEVFIRHLHDRGAKVFITGSNASLLSRELGTRLTGRHLRHELFPFSYGEFLTRKKLKNTVQAFDRYLKEGGFPEFLDSGNPEILQMLLRDIVMRDIAVRYGIRNTKVLMDITLFLLSNIGKEITFNRLRKSFDVGSANTVSDYLSWLEDTYLLFFLPRFSWSPRRSTVNPRKVYAVDTGFVQANTLSFTGDTGRLLENVVFLFLRQRYPDLYYFREDAECDFVVFHNKKCLRVMQVCDELHGENKERELRGLTGAMDFFKMQEGWVITRDQKDTLVTGKKKVKLIPVYEVLTGLVKIDK